MGADPVAEQAILAEDQTAKSDEFRAHPTDVRIGEPRGNYTATLELKSTIPGKLEGITQKKLIEDGFREMRVGEQPKSFNRDAAGSTPWARLAESGMEERQSMGSSRSAGNLGSQDSSPMQTDCHFVKSRTSRLRLS